VTPVVVTFLAVLVKHAHNLNFVLTAKGGPLPNAGFDRNKGSAITVRELEDGIARSCPGATLGGA
jgi:hypothetical protein